MKGPIIYRQSLEQDEESTFEEEPMPLAAESEIETILQPKRSGWKKLFTVSFILLFIALIVKGAEQVLSAWSEGQWSSLLFITAITLILIAGCWALLMEGYRLYKLRERAEEREEAQQLLQSYGVKEGVLFCRKLAKQANIDSDEPTYQRWEASLHENHHDKEVILLYAKFVQSSLDRKVRQEISRYAAESAVMVAVSPFALVDMGFIAWRSFRLINRIAGLYGIELGYYSRLRLFRLVLINIALAGVTEILQDVGMDWFSQDITAKLSVRAAQGLGVGLLTARLGVKAMELCRPLPWLEDERPKLTEFRKDLLALIAERIKK